MTNKNLSTVLHSMKYMNSELVSETKRPAANPMDTFRKQYHTAKINRALSLKKKQVF